MRLEHINELFPRSYHFEKDFELEAPVTRFDPETNRTLVGRPTKVFGESFSYAGAHKVGHPWSESLQLHWMKNNIEKRFHVTVKTCLVGYYPDGNTGIVYHKDVMAEDGLIFNVSFGDARLFRVKWDCTGDVDHYIMQNGDCLLFDGEANEVIQHDVPKVYNQAGPRWSLTFRTSVNR